MDGYVECGCSEGDGLNIMDLRERNEINVNVTRKLNVSELTS